MEVNYGNKSDSMKKIEKQTILNVMKGTSGGVMVSKLDYLTYTSEFGSQWVPPFIRPWAKSKQRTS